MLQTNGPGTEWSRERKFHHGNECSRERIVLGTNIPDTSYLPLFILIQYPTNCIYLFYYYRLSLIGKWSVLFHVRGHLAQFLRAYVTGN